MTAASFTDAELLKFDALADGIALDEAALDHVRQANGGRALTSADYASTSGVILRLGEDVWVNAPIARHNPNFVDDPLTLSVDGDGLVLRGLGVSAPAAFWLAPRYHDEDNANGQGHNTYAFTHGDRVRISPVAGCAYTCKFCDLPYEFRYRRKDVDGLADAVEAARTDPVQPAHHVLISGGTPRAEDYRFMRDVYEGIIRRFDPLPVDIMMVPIPEVVDVPWLADLGVNELSINLEVYDDVIARDVMPRKARLGRDQHLRFVEAAAEVLGAGRVRSMLLVGLESLEGTLAGVRAIVDAGGVPVLSPFRPDPITPLRDRRPPTAAQLREAYEASVAICRRAGVSLGPTCRPCTHNTLTLSSTSAYGGASMSYGEPNVA